MVRDLDFRKMLPLLPEPEFPQPALRWRLGWLLFGGLLLLLFLRRFLNLFHFIFLSHGKHSSLFPQNQKLNGADTRLTMTQAWLTVYRSVT